MKATVRSDPWLRLRAGPSYSAPVVGTIPNGTVIDVNHLENGWAAILAIVQGIKLSSEKNGIQFWWLNASYLELEQPTPPADVVRVPWFSQVGNSYGNDCGPACWAMLAAWAGVNTSVDALVRLMSVQNQYTVTWQSLACWNKLGLQGISGSRIIEPPFLCLVYYPKLPTRYDGLYQKEHWIVVVGTIKDLSGAITGVVYHDPLWPTIAQGAYKQMSVEQFRAAEVSTTYRATCMP